jgi:surface protein
MRQLIYTRGKYNYLPFIMTVDTNLLGNSSNNEFYLNTTAIRYDVKTSDGQEINNITGSILITFPAPGVYDIEVYGQLNSFDFTGFTMDKRKIIEIKQWGNSIWKLNSSNSFLNINSLTTISATDVPNFGKSTYFDDFLAGSTLLTFINNLSNWIFPQTIISLGSNTEFGNAAFSNTLFNQTLPILNLPNCVRISNMFRNNTVFNNGSSSNINDWIIPKVTSFLGTFDGCTIFNQPLDKWFTAEQRTLDFSLYVMLRDCINYNHASISNWNVTNCINLRETFLRCTAFNQPLNSWNTEKVTTMVATFRDCINFNQNLGNWNLSNCTSTGNMFNNCVNFNNGGSDNIQNWDVSKVTTMVSMFSGCTSFNQPLGNWRPKLCTNFSNFFLGKGLADYSAANLDSIYNGWTEDSLQTGRSITFNTIKRTAASTEARALLTRTNITRVINNAVNNGSGLIRITTTVAHGLTTGNKIFISGVLGTTEANKAWNVTVIDATTVDLIGSVFTNAYISGGTLRTGWGWSVTDGGI